MAHTVWAADQEQIMTSKQRRDYLTLAMQQPAKWLIECANNPSPHMTRMHCVLALIAARRKA